MALSIAETKSLVRHFVSAAHDQGLDEEAIVELLPVKNYASVVNWSCGSNRIQNPSVRAIRHALHEWGSPEDPFEVVNAYLTMAQELSKAQRWELVLRLLKDLRE